MTGRVLFFLENRGQSRLSELSPACGADDGGFDGLHGRLAFAAVALGSCDPCGQECGTSTENRSGRVFVTGFVREHPTRGGLAVEFGGVDARDVRRVPCAQQHAELGAAEDHRLRARGVHPAHDRDQAFAKTGGGVGFPAGGRCGWWTFAAGRSSSARVSI